MGSSWNSEWIYYNYIYIYVCVFFTKYIYIYIYDIYTKSRESEAGTIKRANGVLYIWYNCDCLPDVGVIIESFYPAPVHGCYTK